jgi:ribosome biogenesis GTPase / thiamine phosphate phosphatase
VHQSLPQSLRSLGWDAQWAALFSERLARLDGMLRPCRVARVDRGRCQVLSAEGPLSVTFGGSLLDAVGGDATAAPCTGDWGAYRTWPDGPVTLESVLPRRTRVLRADVGESSRGQVLAANLDVVAVVAGLVPEPAIGRVERLVALAWASGASPAVILTKTDLVGDAAEIAADVQEAAPGVPVLGCSVVTGEGLEGVAELLAGGRTMGLLGSSGAGKSSLVNALVGTTVVATREIRSDGRGRHTTVRRELVPLPGGGVLVDTPGLRGIGLVEADDGLAATFSDIEGLVAGCRFNDCSHTSEPGCAVLEAVETGELAQRRLDSWRKLQREIEWMAARADARLRAERTRVWKQRTKEHRRRQRLQ